MGVIRIVVLVFLFAGVVRAEPLTLRGATMGTTYHIKVASPPESVDADGLHAEIENVLAEVDRQMSTYRPDSELSRFNRAAAGEWFPVSAETAEVVAAAREISEKTGGALDVTVGPLVRLWHFGPPEDGASHHTREFRPPEEAHIRAARQRVGYEKLEVRRDPPALRKAIDGLEVDLSSIAPGHAIDRLAGLLSEAGLDDFMVEIGGEVRGAGRREDGAAWRVAIERPAARARELQTAIPLRDAAIATAGDYRNFFEYGGRRYSHVIDPVAGRPVEHALASVTVVANTCLAADGWDTPLVVLGPVRGYDCAERHGVAALFTVRAGDDIDVRATSAWQERFGGDGDD